MKIFALFLFVLMYILMIAKPAYRPFYALSVAAIFLLSGILPPDRLMSTINWNVLLMMSGTMIIANCVTYRTVLRSKTDAERSERTGCINFHD